MKSRVSPEAAKQLHSINITLIIIIAIIISSDPEVQGGCFTGPRSFGQGQKWLLRSDLPLSAMP